LQTSLSDVSGPRNEAVNGFRSVEDGAGAEQFLELGEQG
jgi:hypothetical protein